MKPDPLREALAKCARLQQEVDWRTVAMKQLAARVAALEARIADLEGKPE